MNATWVAAADVAELEAKGRVAYRDGRRFILVLLDGNGTVRAIDNRCPHEGYPLSQGDVKDGVLTCAWHNWKFRLTDGACLIGGEDVRSYEVRVEDGKVLVEIVDPPADAQLEKLDRSLAAAFEEDDWARAAREAERMQGLGRTRDDVLAIACDWSARHAKWGFSHGLAAATDYAALADRYPGDERSLLLEAMHGLVQPNLRRPAKSFASAETAGDDAAAVLRQRVEDEDHDGAQALLRGMLARGDGPDVVFDALTRIATDHFYDYGHGHIYVVKSEELLERIGWDHAHPILTSLLTTIVYGTREDTLPYMRAYRTASEARAERLTAAPKRATPVERPDIDVAAFASSFLDEHLDAVLDGVLAALEAGASPDRVALLLGIAASGTLFRFNHTIDADESLTEGWLHATHLLTHADAIRESLLRHPSDDALRGLFQSARFIQHVQPLLHATADAAPSDPVDAVAALTRAVETHDAELGVAAATALSGDVDVLADAVLATCTKTPLVLPIFVQHHTKTALAAARLAKAAYADPLISVHLASLPLVATVRFLCHPMRERRFRSAAEVARAFVHENKLRESLLGY